MSASHLASSSMSNLSTMNSYDTIMLETKKSAALYTLVCLCVFSIFCKIALKISSLIMINFNVIYLGPVYKLNCHISGHQLASAIFQCINCQLPYFRALTLRVPTSRIIIWDPSFHHFYRHLRLRQIVQRCHQQAQGDPSRHSGVHQHW